MTLEPSHPALIVEKWPTEKLLPYACNARTHGEEQINQIAASILEFGFNNPILVDDRGVLIAGHGRLLAAKQLGMETVLVIQLGHLTDAQARAYRLADNRIAENGGWDEEMLAAELARLNEDDFDLSFLGFKDCTINDLVFPEEENPNGEEDSVPEPPAEPVTQLGDIWELGNHRLLCGDSTDLACVERVMDGALADMVFTDPPYNVNYGKVPRDRLRGKQRDILNDKVGVKFEKFLAAACANMLAVCKGAIYICMTSSELHTLHSAFTKAGGKWSTFIIWAKNSFTLGFSDYQRQFEPILYGWKNGNDHYWCGARDQGDVWFFNRPNKNDLHPTMKPVELVERAILNSSKKRDIVLDCFGGSGSTMIACEKTGRHARLIELDPKYCDVIVKRWEEFTGKKASRVS